MELIVIIGLFIHYFADFIVQTDWEAKNKSINNAALLQHTMTYTLVWIPFVIWWAVLNPFKYQTGGPSLFLFITFATHTVIDYITSRWSKKYFSKGDYHNGFCVIGFDQILHYLQLYFTYKLLT